MNAEESMVPQAVMLYWKFIFPCGAFNLFLYSFPRSRNSVSMGRIFKAL